MKDLIKLIAQAMVDDPEQVSVTEVEGSTTTIFELKVAKDDIGKILGKRGRNVAAIRIILGAASAKLKKRVLLEIIE